MYLLVEVGVGLVLLVASEVVVRPLLGVASAAPESLVLRRLAGAALLAIGIVCWLTRDGLSRRGGPLPRARQPARRLAPPPRDR